MDKLTNKKTLLDSIRLSEGTKFKCNEKAILDEYQIQEVYKSSLAIKILSLLGGFLAILSFTGFLLITGLYNSQEGFVIFGIGFIVLAIWLNKKSEKLIIDTLSISTYIVGFALLGLGLFQISIGPNSIAILIALIALVSLIITQNFIFSFISVLAISGSFIILLISNYSSILIHIHITFSTLLLTYVFLNEAKIISLNSKLSKLYKPIRIGLVISLLVGLFTIANNHLAIMMSQKYSWLSSIIMILVTIYLVYYIIKINEINSIINKLIICTLSTLILITTIGSPSILGAIIIILFSFLVNYKTGLAIGIISIIYFISQYYYDLSLTLLNKSIILFVSGIIFLLFYLFMTKKLSNDEKI